MGVKLVSYRKHIGCERSTQGTEKGILAGVLYGCKTGLLQEAHRLRAFKNRVLRRTFG